MVSSILLWRQRNFTRRCPGNFRLNFKPLKVKIEALIHWLNVKKNYLANTFKTAPHVGQNNKKSKIGPWQCPFDCTQPAHYKQSIKTHVALFFNYHSRVHNWLTKAFINTCTGRIALLPLISNYYINICYYYYYYYYYYFCYYINIYLTEFM